MRRVERHRLERPHDEILLHVLPEELIPCKLNEFPAHAHCHGEAERHHGQIKGRQVHPLRVPVHQIDHGESDRRAQKSVDRVEHRVPAGDIDVEIIDFPENLRRKDKEINGSLEKRRNFNLEMVLHEARNQKQNQRKRADCHAFPVSDPELPDHTANDKNAQYGIDDKRPPAAANPVSKIPCILCRR